MKGLKNMNILVTLDGNYVPHLIVMLKSLMFSNPDAHFDIYVAHSSLTDSHFKQMEKNVDLTRTKIHPVKVSDSLFKNAPILKRTAKETYFRLLLSEYLPESVDRILYIDPDTVVINPIDSLYNIDFKGNIIAAAGHTKGIVELLNHLRLHIGKNKKYVNAGIMMMNVAEMRKSVKTEDIFSYIKENGKKLYLADQDVINGMFWDRTINIDPCIYNLDEKTVYYHKIDPGTGWIDKHTVIVHFNGSEKPWKDEYNGVLAPYYFRYKNMNPKFLGSSRKGGGKKGKSA